MHIRFIFFRHTPLAKKKEMEKEMKREKVKAKEKEDGCLALF